MSVESGASVGIAVDTAGGGATVGDVVPREGAEASALTAVASATTGGVSTVFEAGVEVLQAVTMMSNIINKAVAASRILFGA